VHRKVVTVLFCDVVGSTALGESLDPEALQSVLARYFERMKAIVESHGGTVEKFIGDAVMAVFGVPAVHEDDALRACRAAAEMRAVFPELGVQGRIGVNTGEVVVGTGERLATGDALNVAARLQQAAQPDEILIGEATLELVRGAVESEPVEPLELKGKAEPVAAHRLVSVHDAPERSHESRFVGRDAELALILQAWTRVLEDRECELVTVVGEAGVGKSRLVAEALASIDARIVSGRCLPYGEGITYWPVVEVIKQLDALPSDPAGAAAIRSLLGQTDTGTTAEEIAWAFRKLLEEEAPLVIVVDDVQWGDETLLDLVEGTALLSLGVADPARLHGAAGARRPAPAVAGHRPAGAAAGGCRRRAARRTAARGATREDRRRRSRKPALPHGDARDGRRERGRRRATHAPSSPGRPGSTSSTPRSAGSSRAARSKGRSSTEVPSRRSRRASSNSLPAWPRSSAVS
jgi:class 3 adenylate cyclase